MAKRFMLAALLLLAAAGCAGYRSEMDNNPAFADHYYRRYDLEVDWRSAQKDDTVRLFGTVGNLRSFFLQDLQLNARLLNEQGKVIAKGSYTDFPNYLPPGKTEPFRMELRVPPGEQAYRLHFSYYYWLVEAPPEFRGYDDAPHFGGFVSPP